MKRVFVFVLSLVLLAGLVVPAYAAEERYVPQLPPFVSGGQITAYYDQKATPQVEQFFADFKKDPYVVLITQDSKNGYYQNEYYGDDRLWKLVFVKLSNPNHTTLFGGFVYYDPLFYADRASKPMDLSWNGLSYFDTVTYAYDYNTKQLKYHYFSKVNKVLFSYLIDSSPLSNPASFYPGYQTLAEKYNFVSQPANPRDELKKHYNWWLGKTSGDNLKPVEPDINIDTDGDGEPDVSVDTDGDGTPDLNEDTNGDRKPDLNVDTDGDKKPDLNIDTDGDKKPDLNIDTNGDKKPDLNIDTNGDGKPDLNVDTNGDGKPDRNIDTNGDKKPDLNIDTNGDGKPDLNVDTNGDGKPDTDIDTDGDGKPDQNLSGGGSSSGSSGGGSSSGGSGGTSSHPPWWQDPDFGDDWFPESSEDDSYYEDFPIFDPFSYGNYEPPHYDDPYTDYDPLDGWDTSGKMPDVPKAENPGYNFTNPFPFDWVPGT